MYIGVRKQLEILGADHVGYRGKGFQAASGASFSVVGARPFSKVLSVGLALWYGPLCASAFALLSLTM